MYVYKSAMCKKWSASLNVWNNVHVLYLFFDFQINQPISAKRIGMVKEGFNCIGVDVDISDAVKEAVMKLQGAGATVEETSVPMHRDGYIYIFYICFFLALLV